MNPDNFESESQLFNELRQVLGDAFTEVESEARLDLEYEVAETVRFEQAQVSWRDRARNSTSEIELFISESGISQISGTLTHQSGDFLILNCHRAQYLVNTSAIVAVRGLSDLAKLTSGPDSINWLENVWFHDLCDRLLDVSWYLRGGRLIQGSCIRSGFDAIDVLAQGEVFTIPKSAIAVAKVPNVY